MTARARIDRRALLAGLGGIAATGWSPGHAQSGAGARVVVIGGGYGGASAARTLKTLAPGVDVTLIEPSETYVSCPFSNLVITGQREIGDQGFGYAGLRATGVRMVQDWARGIEPVAKTVTTEGGDTFGYDRLILSPGVEMRWGALAGYGRTAIRKMPHAWKAGAQTVLLRQQLEAMEDGGTVVITAPAAPYRCPPGPYERASLIAEYLKTRKPRSKLILLDAKDTFSKKPLFLAEWAARYPDHLEWRGASEDGRVSRVDPDAMVLETDFDRIEADVANVIPPQKAGAIADVAGVSDGTGWCPVDPVSFESTLVPDVHVIGDAAIAAPMPKSAFAANAQGKLVAIQIARVLAGGAFEPSVLANTCYSYVSGDAAVSVVGVYRLAADGISEVDGGGGISSLDPAPGGRAMEAAEAAHWFDTITAEAFG